MIEVTIYTDLGHGETAIGHEAKPTNNRPDAVLEGMSVTNRNSGTTIGSLVQSLVNKVNATTALHVSAHENRPACAHEK
jgi:hypothetical protein